MALNAFLTTTAIVLVASAVFAKEQVVPRGAAPATLTSLATPDAAKLQALHKFTGGSDGAWPEAGVIEDAAGNLYGTTSSGGGRGCGGTGCGSVFKLAPDGTETVLHAFSGGDGGGPYAGLIEDAAGNLYGTTMGGGASDDGTIFELAPDGTLTVLYAFTDGSDGGFPRAGLIRDKAGNLYGTTYSGGSGSGVVFSFDPDAAAETVLHTFGSKDDGCFPAAGVVMDKAGNLYGTTEGTSQDGRECADDYGTVFKLAPDGTETVLYSFTNGSDGGSHPEAGLIMDSAGNLYGTTSLGGSLGCGTAFELAPNGAETVLHAFGGHDGCAPEAGLIKDTEGNFFGTTTKAGNLHCNEPYGCGTVFKLAPDGTETVLFSFRGKDGVYPAAGLIKGSGGKLYGTTYQGGDLGCVLDSLGCGVVFKLRK